MQQALLRAAGITPSESADTALVSEYLQSIIELAAGRASWYDDSGAADAYELGARTNQQTPASLFDGLELKFFPDNDNTGASTIDAFGLGAVDVKLPGGSTDPAALDILAGVQTTVVYRILPSAHFELINAPSLAGGVGAAIGDLIISPSSVIPTDHLEFAGQAFNPVTFPDLSAVYPSNVLPDMRGEFIRGFDNGRGVDPARVLLSAQADEFESHSHTINTNTGGNPGTVSIGRNLNVDDSTKPTNSVGGSETRPRNIAWSFITRAK